MLTRWASPMVMVAVVVILNVSVEQADAGLIYSNDFESPVGAEWSNTLRDTTPFGARNFLGQFGNETVSLTLAGLTAHTSVEISFDLFVIRSWDGNDFPGPDQWTLGVDGGPTLLDTTFSNTFRNQSYPDPSFVGSHPARTGAAEVNTLGYFFGAEIQGTTDSVYGLDFVFLHSDGTITLNFSALGLQDLDNESWGIDNIRVMTDASSSVPEPASLTLLGMGAMGLVIGSVRRRRQATAAA